MKRLFMICSIAALGLSMAACAGGAKQDENKKDGLDSVAYTVGAQSGLSLNLSDMKLLELDYDLFRNGMVDALEQESISEEEMNELQSEMTGFMMFAQRGLYARVMGGDANDEDLPALYNEQYTREDISYKMGRSVVTSIVYNGVELDKASLIAGFDDGIAAEDIEEFDKDMQMTEDQMNEYIAKLNTIIFENYQKKQEKIKEDNAAASAAWLAEIEQMEGVQKSESGLLYRIDRAGTGAYPTQDSDVVLVNYEGKVKSGDIFDSSYQRNEPISFTLNGVIKGWTEGLKYINEGGQITLWIPADLAYGDNPRPGSLIQPNDALEFKVELLQVNP